MPLPGEGGRLRFAADSDSAIVKGLAAVLLTGYSDKLRRRSRRPTLKPSSQDWARSASQPELEERLFLYG